MLENLIMFTVLISVLVPTDWSIANAITFAMVNVLGVILIFLKRREIPKSTHILAFLFFLCYGLSVRFSIYPRISLEQSALIFNYVLIFIVFSLMSIHKKNIFLKLLIICCFMLGIYGIIQYFFMYPFIKNFIKSTWQSTIFYERVFSTFLSPNMYGCLIAMVIPINIVAILMSKSVAKKLLYSIILFVVGLNLFLTKSILCVFISVFSVLILLIVLNAEQRQKFSIKRIFLGLILLIIVLIGGIFVIKSRLSSNINFQNLALVLHDRFEYFKTSFEIIKHYPLKIFGAGTFGLIYPQLAETSLIQTKFSHNIILQMVIETGVVCLMLFISFLVMVLSTAHKNIRTGKNDIFYFGLLMSIAVFLVHNLFDYSFYYYKIGFVFWALMGLLVSEGVKKYTNKPGFCQNEVIPRHTGKFRINILSAAFVIILVVFSLFNLSFSISGFVGNLYFRKQDITKAIKWDAKNSDYYLAKGCGLAKVDKQFSRTTVSAFKKSISINPYYFRGYVELGKYYTRCGMIKDGVRKLLQARRLYPSNQYLKQSIKKIRKLSYSKNIYFRKGFFLNRPSLLSDRINAIDVLKISVPKNGRYCIYTYVYNNETKSWPVISVKGVNGKNKYSDYIFFEPIWYLGKASTRGRWIFHAIGGSKPWYLEKGDLTLFLKLNSKISSWKNEDADLKNMVAINSFILVPVEENYAGLTNVIETEGFIGGWEKTDYTPRFATGIMHTATTSSTMTKNIPLPSGNYNIYVCAYAPKGASLKINDAVIEIPISANWTLLPVCQAECQNGVFELNVTNLSEDKNYVAIDYFVILRKSN